ncbi:MAG TPA: iron-sulfur cluster insertion protein ErpA [Terriglobales bacterium]|nr:iron-sulfur cluster insertion protein ErpA [Terriglobales bacterium]
MQQNVTLEGVPSTPKAPDDFQLQLTEAAAKMVRALLEREKMPAAGLRVSVSGGGCSGMQYGLTFDPNQRADDIVLQQQGVRIFIDPASCQYLNGTTLDYVHALHGAGFKFLNPNAERTCGCGSSFGV